MSSMRFIEPPQPNDRVVAAEIDGRLAAEDMEALVQRLQPIVERGEKALLYVDMEKYEGYDLGAIAEKLKNIGMLWRLSTSTPLLATSVGWRSGSRSWIPSHLSRSGTSTRTRPTRPGRGC